MKSSTKTKPRATPELSELKSIGRTLKLIADRIQPVVIHETVREVPEPVSARFVKLDADGKPLPQSAKTWSAVRDLKHGLDWSAEDVGAAMPWADAKEACAKLTLCAKKDWRVPTVEELFLLADRSRREPAIDVAFFPTCKSAWYWTSSPYAGNSGGAWFVFFGSGYSDWDFRSNHSYVRACRPSQF